MGQYEQDDRQVKNTKKKPQRRIEPSDGRHAKGVPDCPCEWMTRRLVAVGAFGKDPQRWREVRGPDNFYDFDNDPNDEPRKSEVHHRRHNDVPEFVRHT